MRMCTLDVECFYDRKAKFSLSMMETEEFVRDKRFELYGAAIKWGNEKSFWLDEPQLRAYCKTVDWSQVFMLNHHAHWDQLVMSHHYGVVPKMAGCTLSQGRLMLGNHISVSLDSIRSIFGFPPKITPYGSMEGRHWYELPQHVKDQVAIGACDETDSILAIFQRFMAAGFPLEELETIDTTVKMHTDPVLIGDGQVFANVWKSEQVRRQQTFARLGLDPADLQSSDRFADLLRQHDVEPEKKPGKPNADGSEKLIYAFAKTDPFMEALQLDEDENVRALAEARLGAKSTLLGTRAETMGWMTSRGPLCVYLNYCGAHTTRWSGGGSTNFQNWTNGSDINKGVLAPEGWLIVEPDSSQIECIAEGERVLTQRGWIAIESVIDVDFVWDGAEWVNHDGVICRGEKEVITVDGLTGTPDHVVYPFEHPNGITLGAFAATGSGFAASRWENAVCETALRSSGLPWVQDLWRAWDSFLLSERERSSSVDTSQPVPPDLQGSRDRSPGKRWSLRAWKSQALHATRECQQSVHDFLGACWHWAASYAGLQTSLSGVRLRTRRYQSTSRKGTHGRANNNSLQGVIQKNDVAKTTRRKVYDVLNAGPRHRFTVEGVVVSNCRLLNFIAGQWDKVEEFREGKDPYVGVAAAFYRHPINKDEHPQERQLGKIVELQAGYQSGGESIRRTVRVKSGGKIILTPEQGVEARDAYRATHSAVRQFWYEAEMNIKRMNAFLTFDWGPLLVKCDVHTETRRIVLPNKTELIYDSLDWYVDPDTNESYWRIKTRKGWVKLYGGKLVENIIQALARVVISQAMIRLKHLGYRTVNTKHDSLWLLVPEDSRLEEHKAMISREMNRTPDWLPGIPLASEFKHIGRRYA